MAIIYGIPADTFHMNATRWYSFNFTECVVACQENPECVVAYSGNQNYFNYPYYIQPDVFRYDGPSDVSIVALKVALSGAQCPRGKNAPTFNNVPAKGYLVLSDTAQVYTYCKYNFTLVGTKLTFAHETGSYDWDFINKYGQG
ncbi:PAN-3 domain-containing protein [Caenorhabditis elegans]|uniref:PAN-3 domain-containing protein n=1 Tax=Caenorhabditis elegans TaxID=6239 RepID=I2HAK3_CAEEL|nr:PAN-3 domain-containing protein [Caenorhabditis elegans]CCH63931.1 PAN-3 domain-containing protein [Caenorhabditis elegans]|eukprot:NP_001255230.1 Uncharacterized protein CELE_C50A2.7 [Caenorhabditis elegans]